MPPLRCVDVRTFILMRLCSLLVPFGLRRIRIGLDNSRRIDKFLFPVVAVPASSHPLLC